MRSTTSGPETVGRDAARGGQDALPDDPERFTDVYDSYFDAVHGYVAGRLGVETADDVAAETFLLAFKQRAGFDPSRGSMRAWLFGIATNLVARHRRAWAAVGGRTPHVGRHEPRGVPGRGRLLEDRH
ncbi:RNA polymerase sigma factor [Actinocorallia sp. A-T 12471]|uniref:RNA polymerase sigma factor n=1 Tax=Actinocorallia sp. A-T 12471 TaxID=3089813 RepID=UPI0029D12ACE|nr:sigma factor [Actinocorallia sp. A-T 12471]MDX6742638.1 sigma factor [Actinocorallia sp. A-T 12471]